MIKALDLYHASCILLLWNDRCCVCINRGSGRVGDLDCVGSKSEGGGGVWLGRAPVSSEANPCAHEGSPSHPSISGVRHPSIIHQQYDYQHVHRSSHCLVHVKKDTDRALHCNSMVDSTLPHSQMNTNRQL